MTDNDIKKKIEIAVLKNSKKTGVMVDAILIFETCENKMSQINMTLRPLRGMFGNSFSKSSICILTGCSDKKYKKKADQRIKECHSNGIATYFWDQSNSVERSYWLGQEWELLKWIANFSQPLDITKHL